jgi:glycosyltransferase involved in cell wall biosynthesis
MKGVKIGVVSSEHTLTKRTWVKQDIDILRELGFDVVFVELERGFLGNLKKMFGCHLLFGWFAYHNVALYAKILKRISILNAVGAEVAYYPEFNYGVVKRPYMIPLIALGLKSTDKLIAISNESARWARFWSKRNAEIIYEGIDTVKFKPLKARRNRGNHELLAVAYLEEGTEPRKNLSTLINAMKLVVEQIPDAKLILVGEKSGGYPQLYRQVEELQLEDNIVFKGRVTDEELVRLYNACDVLVMPSLQEGFPTVCCEALSCETPVITSNRPSMNEVFTNNIDALLINPHDQVRMAKTIIRVLKDENLAERLGKNGRALVVKNFSREVRKEKLNKAISEVLEEEKSIGGISVAFLIFYFSSRVFLRIFPLMVESLMRLFRKGKYSILTGHK